MKMFSETILPLCVVAIVGVVIFACHDKKVKEKEQQRIMNELIERRGAFTSVFRDSLQRSETKAKEYTVSDIKEEKAIKKVVEDAGVSIKEVESIHNVAVCTLDTIIIDTTKHVAVHDKWLDLEIKDTILTYSVKDSLTVFVSTNYKHRFLWWRWGRKGYKVNIVTHNPHSKIKYNEYIMIN